MRRAFLHSLTPQEVRLLSNDWRFWARDDQLAPEGESTTWLVLGGRGAGKTRAGAEWVQGEVTAGRAGRIALIGETFADAREVMIDGPSGLRAIAPADAAPKYEITRKRLLWPNGAVAYVFSAGEPDSLRGPQFDAAWGDELAKWRYAEAAWDMLQFGLRLGQRPRQVMTTTPRPMPLLKRLLGDEQTVVTRASTHANRANLADGFFRAIISRYEGTRLGRQELEAELIEDNPDALWSRETVERARFTRAPGDFIRIVVGVDPPDEGLEFVRDDDGDEIITIPAVNELHRIIALGIVSHEYGISGDELRFLRTEMGYTQAELAELVHHDKQSIGRWERGEYDMDSSAEAIIRRLAIEKLSLNIDSGIDELSRRSIPTAQTQHINIRKTNDNGCYELAA